MLCSLRRTNTREKIFKTKGALISVKPRAFPNRDGPENMFFLIRPKRCRLMKFSQFGRQWRPQQHRCMLQARVRNSYSVFVRVWALQNRILVSSSMEISSFRTRKDIQPIDARKTENPVLVILSYQSPSLPSPIVYESPRTSAEMSGEAARSAFNCASAATAPKGTLRKALPRMYIKDAGVHV